MINNVVLVGRLTKDLDLRYTSNGTAVATFTMAVNRAFTNQDGKRDADFINCVIWRKAAENMANFTHKGSLVGIEGTIQSRSYDNQQGQRVYVTEVVLGSFSLLEAKNKDSNNNNHNNYGDEPKSNQSTNVDASSSIDPFEQSGQPIDVSDDDLPF